MVKKGVDDEISLRISCFAAADSAASLATACQIDG